ncbi:hypothetical protein FQN54_009772 [Arachnomyces sp. PD_36]|nr:hypothetical protein FQN54_009772 [Arachnomyces sp. PD_36]
MPSTTSTSQHAIESFNALRKAARGQENSRQFMPTHTTTRETRYESDEEELSDAEIEGHGRLLSPIDMNATEMGPCNTQEPLKNDFYGASLSGVEDTGPQFLPAPGPTHEDKGSRPMSVDTVKRNRSSSNTPPRAWKNVDQAATIPSTPSTTSPLPSPALVLPTFFVPPEATESEAMSYHQSFLNDQTSSDEEPESESSILIATSVNLLVPATRPSLIFITPPPFYRSRSYDRDVADEDFVSSRRSTRNSHGSRKNHSRPRVEKRHRRKDSSLSPAHSNYSNHDLSISSSSSQYSVTPSASIAPAADEEYFTPDPPSKSPGRRKLDRSATIKGARSKRNRHTFVHGPYPSQSEVSNGVDLSQDGMAINYPDVGQWSRDVNTGETHMYSTKDSQSEVPPVPPLTPTSSRNLSSPSWAGTPTTERLPDSPVFQGQEFYHARTTSDRSTATDNSMQSTYSTSEAAPDVVRVKSLRRRKRVYTSERPQSLRSLGMGYDGGNCPPSPQNPTLPARNNPSRKSLAFPYQHIYQPIPVLNSSPASPSGRPSSIRSMGINHNASLTSLTHTNSTSNLSMYSLSYADSEDSEPSQSKRISRKKSMKALRDTRDTIVYRVANKNFKNFGLGSWKRKSGTGSNSNSGMTTPIASYDEGMVR